jgi:hypothetical protein
MALCPVIWVCITWCGFHRVAPRFDVAVAHETLATAQPITGVFALSLPCRRAFSAACAKSEMHEHLAPKRGPIHPEILSTQAPAPSGQLPRKGTASQRSCGYWILAFRAVPSWGKKETAVLLLLIGTLAAAAAGRVFYQVALTVTYNDNGFVTMFFLLVPPLVSHIFPTVADLRSASGPTFFLRLSGNRRFACTNPGEMLSRPLLRRHA